MNRGLFYSNTSSSTSTNMSNNNNIIWFLAVCSLLATGGYLLGQFFGDPKPSRRRYNSLTEAVEKLTEESEAQMAEVEAITHALEDFGCEWHFIINQLEQKQKIQPTFKQYYLQTATEKTTLLSPKNRDNCIQLREELRELMNNHPECIFKDNPCLESIELYAHESREHHEKIINIAAVLLPNLSSLLNEARLANEAPTRKNNS